MVSHLNKSKIHAIFKAVQPLYSSAITSCPSVRNIQNFIPDLLRSVRINKPEFTDRLNVFPSDKIISHSKLVSMIYKSLHWTENIRSPDRADLNFEEFKLRVQEHEDSVYYLLKTTEAYTVFQNLLTLANIAASPIQQQAFVEVLDKHSRKSPLRSAKFLRLLTEWFLDNKPDLARVNPVKDLNTLTYALLIFGIAKDYLSIHSFCPRIVDSKKVNLTKSLEILINGIKKNLDLEHINLSLATIRSEIDELLNTLKNINGNQEIIHFYLIQNEILDDLAANQQKKALLDSTKIFPGSAPPGLSPRSLLGGTSISKPSLNNEKSNGKSILKTKQSLSALRLSKETLPSSSHIEDKHIPRNELTEQTANKSVKFAKFANLAKDTQEGEPFIAFIAAKQDRYIRNLSKLVNLLTNHLAKLRAKEECEKLKTQISDTRTSLLRYWSKGNHQELPERKFDLKLSAVEELILSEIGYLEKLIQIEQSLKEPVTDDDHRNLNNERLHYITQMYMIWTWKGEKVEQDISLDSLDSFRHTIVAGIDLDAGLASSASKRQYSLVIKEVMPTKNQEVMPTKNQEVMPTKNQEVMPTKNYQEAMAAKNEEFMPTKNYQEDMLTKNEEAMLTKNEEAMPTKNYQEAVLTKNYQEAMPTKNYQEVMPTKNEEAMPTKNYQEDMLTKNYQEAVLTKNYQEAVLTKNTEEILPSDNSEDRKEDKTQTIEEKCANSNIDCNFGLTFRIESLDNKHKTDISNKLRLSLSKKPLSQVGISPRKISTIPELHKYNRFNKSERKMGRRRALKNLNSRKSFKSISDSNLVLETILKSPKTIDSSYKSEFCLDSKNQLSLRNIDEFFKTSGKKSEDLYFLKDKFPSTSRKYERKMSSQEMKSPSSLSRLVETYNNIDIARNRSPYDNVDSKDLTNSRSLKFMQKYKHSRQVPGKSLDNSQFKRNPSSFLMKMKSKKYTIEIGKTRIEVKEILKAYKANKKILENTDCFKVNKLIEFYSFIKEREVIQTKNFLKVRSCQEPAMIKQVIERDFREKSSEIFLMDLFKRFSPQSEMKFEDFLQFCRHFNLDALVAPLKSEFRKKTNSYGQIGFNFFVDALKFIAQEKFRDNKLSVRTKLQELCRYLETETSDKQIT